MKPEIKGILLSAVALTTACSDKVPFTQKPEQAIPSLAVSTESPLLDGWTKHTEQRFGRVSYNFQLPPTFRLRPESSTDQRLDYYDRTGTLGITIESGLGEKLVQDTIQENAAEENPQSPFKLSIDGKSVKSFNKTFADTKYEIFVFTKEGVGTVITLFASPENINLHQRIFQDFLDRFKVSSAIPNS